MSMATKTRDVDIFPIPVVLNSVKKRDPGDSFEPVDVLIARYPHDVRIGILDLAPLQDCFLKAAYGIGTSYQTPPVFGMFPLN